MITIIHVQDGFGPLLCGAEDGDYRRLRDVLDPENPEYFTCGKCWKIIAGGLEPMGGSLHRSEAHEL